LTTKVFKKDVGSDDIDTHSNRCAFVWPIRQHSCRAHETMCTAAAKPVAAT
jgi:hypothetical protein